MNGQDHHESRLLFRHGRGILFFSGRQCPADRCHRPSGANECRPLDDAPAKALFRDVLCRSCRFRRRFRRFPAQGQGDVHHQYHQVLRLQPDFRRCPSPFRLCDRRSGSRRLFPGQVRYPDGTFACRKTGHRQRMDRGADGQLDRAGDRSGRRAHQQACIGLPAGSYDLRRFPCRGGAGRHHGGLHSGRAVQPADSRYRRTVCQAADQPHPVGQKLLSQLHNALA